MFFERLRATLQYIVQCTLYIVPFTLYVLVYLNLLVSCVYVHDLRRIHIESYTSEI